MKSETMQRLVSYPKRVGINWMTGSACVVSNSCYRKWYRHQAVTLRTKLMYKKNHGELRRIRRVQRFQGRSEDVRTRPLATMLPAQHHVPTTPSRDEKGHCFIG